MADPVTTTTIDPASLEKSAEALRDVNQEMENLSKGSDILLDRFKTFISSSDSLTSSITKTGIATDRQAVQFAGLSGALLGTISAYNNFGTAIEKSNVNLFSDQIDDITKSLGSDGVISKMGDLAKMLGQQLPANALKSAEAAKNYVKGILGAADNTLKFQNALIQLSASTGQLGNLYATVGDSLGDLNAATTQQMALVSSVAAANNLSTETVTSYYGALSKIPGAVNAQAIAIDGAGKSTDMFSATIKLATGTGQSFTNVVTELSHAFHTYGATGTDALKFVSRISEVSNAVEGDLSQVSKILGSTAENFKYIGNNTDSAAKALQTYTNALKASGVATGPAIDLAGQLISKVSGLSLAQKAFISQTTGGGGGLLGGLRIEQALEKDGISGVLEKVRLSIQKQLGPIVTRKDAVDSGSQSQASNYVRQREILKSQLNITDDAQANKILEAFKQRQTGATKEADLKSLSEGLDKSISRGEMIQSKSLSELSIIRGVLEKAQGARAGGALTFAQNALTASGNTGSAEDETASRKEMRDSLFQYRKEAETSVANIRRKSDEAYAGNSYQGKGGEGQLIADTVNGMKTIVSTLPTTVRNAFETATKLSGAGDFIKSKDDLKKLENDAIRNSATAAQERDRLQKADPKKYNDRINEQQLKVDQFNRTADTARILAARMPTTNVVQQSVKDAKQNTKHESSDQNVHVTVEGLCLDCGKKITNTYHKRAISPVSN